jgi:hypothetical protein
VISNTAKPGSLPYATAAAAPGQINAVAANPAAKTVANGKNHPARRASLVL